MRLRMLILLSLLAVLIAACDSMPATPTPSEEAIEEAVTDEVMTEEAMTEEDMTEEAMSDEAMTEEDMTEEAMSEEDMSDDTDMSDEESSDAGSEAMTLAYDGPEWADLSLVNARTGESFRLADYAGKTIFVEPMATWCTNCRAQQRQVAQAIPELGTDDFVFISLSVEGNLANERLASYADDNNFDWIFVVSTAELTEALIGQFGRTVANPPATPHFTIAPDGSVSSLSLGSHSAEQLIAELRAVSAS